MKTCALTTLTWGLALVVLDAQALAQDSPGDVKKQVLALVNTLHGIDAQKKLQAAEELADIAGMLRVAAGSLGADVAYEHYDPELRRKKAQLLMAIGPSAHAAIPQLRKALKTKDAGVRIAVIEALAAMAPFSKKAIPDIVKQVNDHNPAVRRAVVSALGLFGSDAAEGVPVLVAAIGDPDPGVPKKNITSVRVRALLSLQLVGPNPKAAAQVLEEMKGMEAVSEKAYALAALTKLMAGDPKLVPMLLEKLKDKNQQMLHLYVVAAFRLMGPEAKAAVPHLVKMLRNRDVGEKKLSLEMQENIVVAFGAMGPAAQDAVPVLKALAASTTHANLRDKVHDALQRIQHPPEEN